MFHNNDVDFFILFVIISSILIAVRLRFLVELVRQEPSTYPFIKRKDKVWRNSVICAGLVEDTSWEEGNEAPPFFFNFAFFSHLWNSQIRQCMETNRIGHR